ncbi:MAG: acyl-CoA desaturase [Bacteroidetes bacterium]|nr:acyl-CoA desaturase [Bacteroidota bacterium]
MYKSVKFNPEKSGDFHATLKWRASQYFRSRNISEYANGLMIFKTTFLITAWIATYLLLVFGQPEPVLFYLLWVNLGFFTAFIAVNICHDAIHNAYSSNKKVNKFLGLIFNLVGANAYVWKITHNIAHHTFPNIDGHDEDIEQIVSWLRLSPYQKLKKIHRYQYWYAFLFYGLGSLSWVFIKDYKKFFQKKIGNLNNTRHAKIEYFNLFFFKAVYYTVFLIIPVVITNFSWWHCVLGFVVSHICEGSFLAIVFMLAHEVEGLDFPKPDRQGNIRTGWAVHQLMTTADFARKNSLVNFFCGGLNFQIEHHLFPRVCHVHYRNLSGIVEMTAKEFNIPYVENKTFLDAVGSHIRLLKRWGREQPADALSARTISFQTPAVHDPLSRVQNIPC